MVRGKFKSRTFRRVHVRTIKGSKLTFKRRKPSKATCYVTGEVLKGVPRGTPGMIKKLAKSSRRPSRPFGGVLSSRASRQEIRNRARAKQL